MGDGQILEKGDVSPPSEGRRLTPELDFDELKPFDENAYVQRVAEFMVKNLPADDEATVEDIVGPYDRGGFTSMDRLFLSILTNKFDLKREQINSTPKSELVRKLYSLGCPELYFFHKTAQRTEIYGIRREEITPDPFNHDKVWVTRDLFRITEYGQSASRPVDINPYVMAFPMLEVLEATDTGGPRRFTNFNVSQIDFKNMNEVIKAKITEKTRFFSFIHREDIARRVSTG